MIRRSSSASRSSSAASDLRACQPNGRTRPSGPACSHVTECHGPAQTTNIATGIGGVVANCQQPVVASTVARPLASTVHSSGARTVSVTGALRSFWSKQGKTRCAMSMPTYADT